MQTGSDLVGAGYPTARPVASLLGGLTNVAVPNVPARTNLDYNIGTLVDGTAPSSGVAYAVAVPVLPGDTVTKVTVLVGATAASVPTHQFAALYAGTGSAPALIGQTADATSGSVAASAAYSFTFGTPQLITPTNSPYGFIYVSVMVAATTVPTLVSGTTATAAYYAWTTTGPLWIAATHGSSLTATAPATIASASANAKAPVVIVT